MGSAKNFVLALKKKINAVKSIADAPKPTATPSKKRAKSAIGRTSDDEDVSPRTPKKKKVSEKERELSTTATKRPRKNKHKSSVYVHPDADSEGMSSYTRLSCANCTDSWSILDGDDEEKIHLPIPANPLSDIFEIGRSVKEPAVKPEPED